MGEESIFNIFNILASSICQLRVFGSKNICGGSISVSPSVLACDIYAEVLRRRPTFSVALESSLLSGSGNTRKRILRGLPSHHLHDDLTDVFLKWPLSIMLERRVI